MVMTDKRFHAPKDYSTCLSLMDQETLLPFAGGTDLMVMYKERAHVPAQLPQDVLFLPQVPPLTDIHQDLKTWTIGSMVTLEALLREDDLPSLFKTTLDQMASPAIRHRGTLGGNVMHASPAGDTLPVLYIFDAELVLEALCGTTTMPIETFITGPGRTKRETNQLLKSVVFTTPKYTHEVYHKVGGRRSDAISKVSMVGLAHVNKGTVIDFRVAFGAVAPTVVRVQAIEESVVGLPTPLSPKIIHDVVQAYAPYVVPITDQRSTALYRRACAMNLLRDFLKQL